jgi:hypothetical protein
LPFHAKGGGEFICGLADEASAAKHHRAQGAVKSMLVLALVIPSISARRGDEALWA